MEISCKKAKSCSQQQAWGMGRSEVKEEAEGRGTRTESRTPSLLRAQPRS